MKLRCRTLSFALVVLGTFAGCEAGGPAAPELTAPSASTPSTAAGDGSYTLVQAPPLPALLETSEWVGRAGGTLRAGNHSLGVPAGAVHEPTLFTMAQLAGGTVQVELLALELDPLLGFVDVGSDGFHDGKRVRLTLSYAGAIDLPDPTRLRILRLEDDGTVTELPTTLDTAGRTVSAELEHFSRYCMAID